MTTKRTHGPCLGSVGGCRFDPGDLAWDHSPDCPSLYPAQQEPDALTRLCKLVRQRWTVDADDRPITDVLDLISEAREEQRKAAVRAKNEGLEKAAAHFYEASRRMSLKGDAESRGEGVALHEYAEIIRAMMEPER